MTRSAELLERFENPGPDYTPAPFWWWSGAPVTRARLRWQMEQLVSQGVRQAVIICLAPTGPVFGSLADEPAFLSDAWIELADQACEDARDLGFRFWIYDQIGDPTGSDYQERLVAHNPDFAGLALRRRADGVVERELSGFDYFGIEACAALLDRVHGELERTLGRWFGDVIVGLYQDELPWMPTWGRDFAETFVDHYGYDLEPRLARLFEGVDHESARIRHDFHAHRARLAKRAFFDPLATWFDRNGLLYGFDQGAPAKEGDPIGGALAYGDYLGTHRVFTAPGCDHWGDVKVHSSLAHAAGHERTWIEAFHQAGWGSTLEETYDWLAPFLRRGANLYNPHAVYYAMVGGWWEFAPPSTCWRQPYWPAYHQFAGAISRLCSVLTVGTHVCDVALLSPTATAQGYLCADGRPLAPALAAADCYHELNGVSRWFTEKPGVLDRAGIDYDILDEATIASGRVVPGGLEVGDETYRTIVLPDVELLADETAACLVSFERSGGRVVCVGRTPPQLGSAVARVEDAAAVPAAVVKGPVRVVADAPYLLRRHGDTFVLLLTAHDERSGTRAPMVRLGDGAPGYSVPPWRHASYTEEYFREVLPQLREHGYDFRGPGDRRARVEIAGVSGPRVQQWDPRTGARVDLAARVDGDSTVFEVPFDRGGVALVVLGDELPDATVESPGPPVRAVAIDGPWRALAESSLDNRDGDLAAADRVGTLPIEVWQLEHWTASGWAEVTAGYGPFAEISDPDGNWRPAQWSLSRGIHRDPAHGEVLGPRGYVQEEFLDWREVPAGATVAVRTHLTLPEEQSLYLAVGSAAPRRVRIDGAELASGGTGYYWTFGELPPTAAGRTVRLEIEFTAERSGPLRAGFAVVREPGAFRRPEWLTGTVLRRSFALDEIPDDTTIQVASDGECTVVVNGVEVARQGGLELYASVGDVADELLAGLGLRVRIRRHDLKRVIRVGQNELTVRLVDGGAVAIDAPALDVATGPGWRDAVPLRHRGVNRRLLCATPRPHPLPKAHWLEPAAAAGDVVVPLIPDLAPGARSELLRFHAPLGTTGVHVPTELDVVVEVAGREYVPVDGWVRLAEPLAAGTPATLRFDAVDGRRGGALLERGIEVEVTEAATELLDWERLGLRALGGQVRYRTTFQGCSGRAVLDLGDVRGTADVIVNGRLVDQLVWGPWRTEVTGALRTGENELEVVVRGTLAGYLDATGPTPYVYAGQLRTGLLGPVQLLECGDEAESARPRGANAVVPRHARLPR